MQELAVECLCDFQKSCWLDADEMMTGMIPIESYMPNPLIESLVDSLPTLYTLSMLQSLVHDGEINHKAALTVLAPFTTQNPCVTNHSHELVQILIDLHHNFNIICERKQEEMKAK